MTPQEKKAILSTLGGMAKTLISLNHAVVITQKALLELISNHPGNALSILREKFESDVRTPMDNLVNECAAPIKILVDDA